MLALVGLSVVLAACGSDDPVHVVWTCTCDTECDGVASTSAPVKDCGTQSDADKAVTDATASCETTLGSTCNAYSCACQCDPGNSECAP
jgi:hypothetical protein